MIKNKYVYAYLLILVLIAAPSTALSWEHYFDKPIHHQIKISPDGKHLGIVKTQKDRRVLIFYDLENRKMAGGASISKRDQVGSFHWVNNERVVIKLYSTQTGRTELGYYGELYSVDIGGKDGELIFGYRAQGRSVGSRIKTKDAIRGWAEIIDVLPEDPKHILISSEPVDKERDKLRIIYKLNVYNGITKNRQDPVPVAGSRYVTDSGGNIAVGVGVDSSLQRRIYRKNPDEWVELPSQNFGNSLTPLTLDDTGRYLYTLDNPNKDMTGVHKLDINSAAYSEFYTNQRADITGLEFSANGRSIYAARIDDGRPSYILLNKTNPEAQTFKSLLSVFPGNHVDITSSTDDGSKYVVHVGSDTNPGEFFLFDKAKNSVDRLFKEYPEIDTAALFESQPISFKSSDGLTINGYLTEAGSGVKPLVVLVHGGPHARDYWSFDPTVQALANQGYSVLQVNYRGSTGYGNRFFQAGFGEWGEAIQRDIYEALQWAIKNGKANKDNVCIMGASFGGYSAVQNSIKYPGTWKCAIGNAGVYDLLGLFREGDVSRYYTGAAYLNQTLGSDEGKLTAMSPVYNTDKITTPLLIAHGKKDERAPYAQAKRFKSALDKSKVDYEWHIVSREGHGFYDPDNQKEYMRKVFKFLSKHLKK